MATITFQIRSKKSPATIYVRIKNGRQIDVRSPTNFLVDPEQWNPKGLPRNLKTAENKKLKADLDNLRSKLLNALNDRKSIEIVDTNWVKNIITPSNQLKALPQGLIEYFEYYIHQLESSESIRGIAKSTVSKYKVIKNLLVGLQRDMGKTILLNEIDLGFKNKFDNYCLKLGYSPNTIGRAIKFVKTVCRDARVNGIETHFHLDSIKGKTHKASIIYLNFDELEKIGKQELNESLDNARDWLIISCFTGQRVSDFMRFHSDQIRAEKGKQLIEFTQVKTRKMMTLPLHPKVQSILSKRNGVFPRKISEQKYNELIKAVCKKVGITEKVEGGKVNPKTLRKEAGIFEKWELVTSHIGRRSFASNFYGKIPTSLLIHATGHSTENMFLQYIGKSGSDRAIELGNYF